MALGCGERFGEHHPACGQAVGASVAATRGQRKSDSDAGVDAPASACRHDGPVPLLPSDMQERVRGD